MFQSLVDDVPGNALSITALAGFQAQFITSDALTSTDDACLNTTARLVATQDTFTKNHESVFGEDPDIIIFGCQVVRTHVIMSQEKSVSGHLSRINVVSPSRFEINCEGPAVLLVTISLIFDTNIVRKPVNGLFWIIGHLINSVDIFSMVASASVG